MTIRVILVFGLGCDIKTVQTDKASANICDTFESVGEDRNGLGDEIRNYLYSEKR